VPLKFCTLSRRFSAESVMRKPEPVMSSNEAVHGSSGLTMVVAQHSSESLAPSDQVVNLARVRDGPRRLVSKSLVSSLAWVVDHVLSDRLPKRCLSNEDRPIQTFFLVERTNRSANAFKLRG